MSVGRAPGSRIAQVVAMIFLVSCSPLTSLPKSTPDASAPSALTPAERVQLTSLERRPLVIPQMPSDGNCPDGPQSTVSPFGANSASYLAATGGKLYGSGPTYLLGGPETGGQNNIYFDVTLFTDPTVQGVVVVRAEQLGGRWQAVVAGPLAAGATVGTDTIGGQRVILHSEVALPASRPPLKAGVAPGWGLWEVRVGIDKNDATFCVGWQIDSASSTEVFVTA